MRPPPVDPSRELQPALDILNQVFEIEKKVQKLREDNSIARNIRRLRSQFADGHWIPGSLGVTLSLTYHDPTGESYDETRTDCDASIAGSSAENLRIVETIKPIIRLQQGDFSVIVQRAVVVAAATTPS
jgi:hypothetical protein